MQRRTVLQTVGATTAAAVGMGVAGAQTRDHTSDVSVDFSVTGTNYDASNEASVDCGTPTVVTGRVVGNNSCYTAELRDATYTNGRLSLTVASVDDADPGQACLTAITGIEYEAEISGLPSTPDEVVVNHESLDTWQMTETCSGGGGGGGTDLLVDFRTNETEKPTSALDVDCGQLTTVSGVLELTSSCEEAVLKDATSTDGRLTVEVTTESTASGDTACAQVVSTVEYTATVANLTAPPDQVEVVENGTTVAITNCGETAHDVDFTAYTAPGYGPDVSESSAEISCGTPVEVDGSTAVGNPGRMAALESASLDDGTLTLRVGERDNPVMDSVFPVVVQSRYEATVNGVDETPDEVVVEHANVENPVATKTCEQEPWWVRFFGW